jgi:hypothetical protein
MAHMGSLALPSCVSHCELFSLEQLPTTVEDATIRAGAACKGTGTWNKELVIGDNNGGGYGAQSVSEYNSMGAMV